MKKLHILAFLFAITGAMFTSCDPEPGEGNEGSPSTSLVSDPGFETTDITIAPGATFSVRVSATPGDSDLNTFEVLVDGVNLSTDNFTIDGAGPGANPKLLFEPDTKGFVYDVTITASSSDAFEEYAFVVTSTDGTSDRSSIIVTTDSNLGEEKFPEVMVSGGTEVDLDPNALYIITISATPPEGRTLAQFEIYQDGVLVDPSRLTFAGTGFSANPYDLPAEFAPGFTNQSLEIRVQDEGSSEYEIQVIDSDGFYTSAFKTVHVGNSGTPVNQLTGVLLNQAGPQGQGGLDLSSGNGDINSTDAAADIKDEGIDSGQPDATNWKKQISGANNATIKYLRPGENGLPEGFTFSGVATKEVVQTLHSQGAAFTVSDEVSVGDMFTVLSGSGEYFVLAVTAINPTTTDNADSYTFDIKY